MSLPHRAAAFVPQGRFGNAVFQYIACKLFCVTFGYEYAATPGDLKEPGMTIFETEADRLWKIMETPLSRVNPMPNAVEKSLLDECAQRDVLLHGYFQNFRLINEHYETIRSFFNAENTDLVNPTTRVCDLVARVPSPHPYIAIHVRLDDFYTVGNSIVLPLAYYEKCIDYISDQMDCKEMQVYIVSDALRKRKERGYVQHIQNYLYRRGFKWIQLHQKSLLEDWWVCRDATIFLSSNSTFAWTALIAGNPTVAIVPNDHYHPHQVIEPLHHIPTCMVWDT